MVSKPIPIGDRTLDIERNIFNANVEKKLSEDGKVKVLFLDHGNLPDQGFPIKPCYRLDLVHLVPYGIDVLTTNLRRMIIQVLKKDDNPDNVNQRKPVNNNRQDIDYHYKPRFNESHRTSDEVYNRRRYNQDGYSGYRGNYESMGHRNTYSGNRDGYPYRDYNRNSE